MRIYKSLFLRNAILFGGGAYLWFHRHSGSSAGMRLFLLLVGIIGAMFGIAGGINLIIVFFQFIFRCEYPFELFDFSMGNVIDNMEQSTKDYSYDNIKLTQPERMKFEAYMKEYEKHKKN